jgi:drug/metabolite transporter (DMT)-like permease
VAPVVVATLCWSTSGIFVSWSLQGSNLAPLGWLLACAGVLHLSLRFPRSCSMRLLIARAVAELPWLVGLGVFGVGIFQVLWILSIITNGASLATVVQCNAPIIVTMLARIFWRESLTWRKWAAIGLASLGTALVAQLGGTGNLQFTTVGLLIALGSALAYAGITLFTKKLADDGVNQWTILVYSFGFAALALLPFQFSQPRLQIADRSAVAAFVGLVLIQQSQGMGRIATPCDASRPASHRSLPCRRCRSQRALLSSSWVSG